MLKYSKAKYNLGVYLPILFCVSILLFFRSDYSNANVLIHKFSNISLNLSQSINLNNIVIYNLPEAFWVFSLTLLSLNYKIQLKRINLNLIYIPLLYVWLAEFLQLINITDGTFDLLDLLFSFISWGIAYFLLKTNTNLINNKQISIRRIFLFTILLCSVFLADTSNI
jgi:hypothetical protein